MKKVTEEEEFMLVKMADHVVLRRYYEAADTIHKIAAFPEGTDYLVPLSKKMMLFGTGSVYQIVDSSCHCFGTGRIGKNLVAEKWLDDGKKGLQVIEFNPALRQSTGFRFLAIENGRYYCCTALEKTAEGVRAMMSNGKESLFKLETDYRSDYESGVEEYISTMDIKNQTV